MRGDFIRTAESPCQHYWRPTHNPRWPVQGKQRIGLHDDVTVPLDAFGCSPHCSRMLLSLFLFVPQAKNRDLARCDKTRLGKFSDLPAISSPAWPDSRWTPDWTNNLRPLRSAKPQGPRIRGRRGHLTRKERG